MAEPLFPNFMQMRERVSRRTWDAIRVASLLAALALCITLFVSAHDGLFVFWGLIIPLLPLLFFLAPGFWRNVCPLATSNQAPRRLGLQRSRSLPPTVRAYGFLVPIVAFLALVPARKVVFNSNGVALGILLLATLAVAFVGGVAFKGKSGWCSSFCPLLPVQRVYGQTPFIVVRNSHCEPCVGCAKNCYDFNPHVAQIADFHDPDPYRGAYRKLFAGAFPGLVLAYYTADADRGHRGDLRLVRPLHPRRDRRVLRARRGRPHLLGSARRRLRRGRARSLLLVQLARTRPPDRGRSALVVRLARAPDRLRALGDLDRPHDPEGAPVPRGGRGAGGGPRRGGRRRRCSRKPRRAPGPR